MRYFFSHNQNVHKQHNILTQVSFPVVSVSIAVVMPFILEVAKSDSALPIGRYSTTTELPQYGRPGQRGVPLGNVGIGGVGYSPSPKLAIRLFGGGYGVRLWRMELVGQSMARWPHRLQMKQRRLLNFAMVKEGENTRGNLVTKPYRNKICSNNIPTTFWSQNST